MSRFSQAVCPGAGKTNRREPVSSSKGAKERKSPGLLLKKTIQRFMIVLRHLGPKRSRSTATSSWLLHLQDPVYRWALLGTTTSTILLRRYPTLRLFLHIVNLSFQYKLPHVKKLSSETYFKLLFPHSCPNLLQELSQTEPTTSRLFCLEGSAPSVTACLRPWPVTSRRGTSGTRWTKTCRPTSELPTST